MNPQVQHNPQRPLELKFAPAHRVNFDPGCDQGYGSERSPEDEMAPPSLASIVEGAGQLPANHEQMLQYPLQSAGDRFEYEYDFITEGRWTNYRLYTYGGRSWG